MLPFLLKKCMLLKEQCLLHFAVGEGQLHMCPTVLAGIPWHADSYTADEMGCTTGSVISDVTGGLLEKGKGIN